MNNAQFATAVHIMTMLARTGDSLSSAYIAGSININSSMVRISLSVLSANGLIKSKEGKGGGNILAKAADKIVLSDIYTAVNNAYLLGKLNSPNPECNTGKQINDHLTHLYREVDRSMVKSLSTISLADFCSKFK
ncbi:Rrf2 family transcriptional regulator [Pedobacter jeongneungensis]|uniref:Rrf2 family transcriptional regulator n=1 Tax=Pedobacter jeongneungensis TaxID=947309 RepID=A0ABP8B7C8_9SPHI